jgi:cytidylate kinase
MTTVAIDGPAGAGKSTVARLVADALGFEYLDTGAMYRAVALAALQRGVDPSDGAALGRLAASLDLDVGERVTLDGRDVTAAIRTEEVSRAVSEIAAHPEVRESLAARQRTFAGAHDVVMEGRDIGTSVTPRAEVKVFLTASAEERARRRGCQLGLARDSAALEEVRRAIQERDRSDAGRAASPFARAPDALIVDSTGRSARDVAREIVARVREVVG